MVRYPRGWSADAGKMEYQVLFRFANINIYSEGEIKETPAWILRETKIDSSGESKM